MNERRLAAGGVCLLVLGLLAVFAVGAGPLAAPQSTTTTIDSCTAITEPGRYELARNVTDGEAVNCIRIEASDVVFDGKGHVVDGVNRSGTSGVLVGGPTRPSNVMVTNVSTRGWGSGIHYLNATDGRITAVSANDNYVAGVKLRGSSDVTVRNVTVVGNGVGFGAEFQGNGVRIRNGSGNTVWDVLAEGNNLDGIRVIGSSENAIRNVVSTENGRHGILIDQSAHDNTVTDSRFDGNDRDGMTVRRQSRGNELVNNTAVDNGHDSNDGDGVELFLSDETLVKDNEVRGNPDDGISVNNDSRRNRIVGNVVSDNRRAGVLIRVNSTGNRVVDNRITGNEYGVYVENVTDDGATDGELFDVVFGLEAIRFSVGEGVELFDSGENRLVRNTICRNSETAVHVGEDSHGPVQLDNDLTC